MNNASRMTSFFCRLIIILWCLLATLPFIWMTIQTLRVPLDAFSRNPLDTLLAPRTIAQLGGVSLFEVILVLLSIGGAVYLALALNKKCGVKVSQDPRTNHHAISRLRQRLLKHSVLFSGLVLMSILVCALLLVPGESFIRLALHDIFPNWLTRPRFAFTFEHYQSVWIDLGFSRHFVNSLMITLCVVVISLSAGALAGYAFARSQSSLVLWLLLSALLLRALPHVVLVSGYLPFFINSKQIFEPYLGTFAPTLFGKHWAVVMVLVAINQPFTIWILRAFFQKIPPEIDDAARIDGCNHLGVFWRMIIPLMWPGLVTAGIFSFLLAYNDYLVTSLLLDTPQQPMVPAINSFFNRETTIRNQIEAVAAAVSITAPLFFLALVFQKQIVSGFLQGAVKGES